MGVNNEAILDVLNKLLVHFRFQCFVSNNGRREGVKA